MDETFIVAFASLIFFIIEFLVLRQVYPKSKFEIVAFSHALLATVASFYVVFTFGRPSDYIIHTLQGEKPLVIEKMLPMVTWGYSIYDIGNGIYERNLSFLYHGVVLFLLCYSLFHFNCLHYLTGPLLMEISTVLLNLLFLKSMVINLSFVVTFLIMRWCVIPYLWYYYIKQAFYNHIGTQRTETQTQLPADWVVLIGGIAFHCLNVYWGIKILKKAHRTLNEKQD